MTPIGSPYTSQISYKGGNDREWPGMAGNGREWPGNDLEWPGKDREWPGMAGNGREMTGNT